MSQYKEGTASVTNASATVAGTGTLWLTNTNVQAGQLFTVDGSGIPYFVASVVSDTELTLTAPYGGSTASGVSYVIHRDFTASGYPLLNVGDREVVTIYNRMVQLLETRLPS